MKPAWQRGLVEQHLFDLIGEGEKKKPARRTVRAEDSDDLGAMAERRLRT